jgi:hypothetical protein
MARRHPLVMIQCTCLIRYLVQFAYLLLLGFVETSRVLVRCLRPRAARAAEPLFLRTQLALYQEQKVNPRRATHATRLA